MLAAAYFFLRLAFLVVFFPPAFFFLAMASTSIKGSNAPRVTRAGLVQKNTLLSTRVNRILCATSIFF
jgi:hypothetical protein